MRLPRYRLRPRSSSPWRSLPVLGMGTIVGLARCCGQSCLRQAAHHRKLSNDARLYAMSIDRRYLHWRPSEPERAEMAVTSAEVTTKRHCKRSTSAPPATPGSPSSQTRPEPN